MRENRKLAGLVWAGVLLGVGEEMEVSDRENINNKTQNRKLLTGLWTENYREVSD